MKKITSLFVVIVMFFSLAPFIANAQTAASVQSQIQSLMQQLSRLQSQLNSTTPAPTTSNAPVVSASAFTRNLTVGSQGSDVSALQQILINDGYLSAITTPSGYFGQATKAALIQYQQANNISPATGYFGPLTMASVNAKTTGGTTQSSSQSSTNSTPTPSVTSVQLPPSPLQPSPITLSGQGQQATQKFTLTQGLAVFSLTNSGGTSNFSAELLDSNGNLVSLLANTVGSFNGSQGVNIPNAGTYLINVTSDGDWTINVTQPRTSTAPSTTSFSGYGEQATQLFYLPAGLQVYYMAHNGQQNFSVELLDQNGNLVSLLANTVGSFNGSQAVNISTAGLYMFNVQADGNWLISTSPVGTPSASSPQANISTNSQTQTVTSSASSNPRYFQLNVSGTCDDNGNGTITLNGYPYTSGFSIPPDDINSWANDTIAFTVPNGVPAGTYQVNLLGYDPGMGYVGCASGGSITVPAASGSATIQSSVTTQPQQAPTLPTAPQTPPATWHTVYTVSNDFNDSSMAAEGPFTLQGSETRVTISCALTYGASTGALVASLYVPHTSANFPSGAHCPVDGDQFIDNDVPAGQYSLMIDEISNGQGNGNLQSYTITVEDYY